MNTATNKTAIDALTDARTMLLNATDSRYVIDNVVDRLNFVMRALAPTVQEAEQGMPLDFTRPLETEQGKSVIYVTQDVIQVDCARVCVDQATGIVYSSPYRGLKIRNVATPVAQDAAVQGSVDIPQWHSRTNMYADPQACMTAMKAEINDLRAALAQRAAVAEVASDLRSAYSAIIRTITGLRDGWADRNDADEAIAMLKAFATPTASTPPAPAEKGETPRWTAEQVAKVEEIGAALHAKMRTAPMADPDFAPAPSEPAPQGVPGLRKAQELLPKLHSLFNRLRKPSNIRVKCEEDSRTIGDASELCRTIINACAAAPAPAATSGGEARTASVMAVDLSEFDRLLTAFGNLQFDAGEWDEEKGVEVSLEEIVKQSKAARLALHSFVSRPAAMGSAALAPQSLPAASDASARANILEEAMSACWPFYEDENDAAEAAGAFRCITAIRALISKEQA